MDVTAGPEAPGTRISHRSIGTGEKIPNVAIFLKRTALEFLQAIFSQRPLGSFHYDQDDTKSEIIIADIHSVDLTTVSGKPAIIASRGPLEFIERHLGSVESRDIPTGNYTFKTLLSGSVALSCISREGIEAEQIGHLVFNSFKYFRPILQRYGFFTIKSLNIGAETLIEQEGADDKTTAVPVYVSALIEDRWTLSDKAARKLEKIVISHVFDVG